MAEQVAFNRDCMEAMKEFPDKFFDLAVVDPPYGIGYDKAASKQGNEQYGKAKAKKRFYHGANWDAQRPDKSYFDELFRVSQKCIIWGGNYFADMLPPSKGFVCWDKRVNDAMTNDFADCEYAYMSESLGVARMFRFCWSGMIQGNMKNKEERIHPTQKPVALYVWLYKRYAKKGDKILDTHLGSGSSRIAAYDAGLDFWGYEIDKFYFEEQEKRFERHTSQINLFLDSEQIDLFSGKD